MKKLISSCFCMILLATSLASYGADTEVEWVNSGSPASLGDVISLTYDFDGAIVSLQASPSESGTIYVTGEAMTFADNAEISLLTPGKLVFSNDVSSAGTLKIGKNDPDAEISYSGAIISGTEYVRLFEGKRLSDYDVKSTYFRYPNGCEGYTNLVGALGYGTPECVQRGKTENGADTMRVLLQKFNDDYLTSVELLLRQGEDGIYGKISNCRYAYGHVNVLGVDLQKHYNQDSLFTNGTEMVVYRGIASPTSKGFGINQLTMIRCQRFQIVCFAGNIQASDIDVKGRAKVEWIDLGNRNLERVKGCGEISLVSNLKNPVYTNYYNQIITKEDAIVAYNRDLLDLVSVDGWFRNVNTAHQPISMRAHHLKIANNSLTATCQFQRLVGGNIFCMIVTLKQSGSDIKAKASSWVYHPTVVDNQNFDIGIDFESKLPSKKASSFSSDINTWGLFLRDITLNFNTPQRIVTTVLDANTMTNCSAITIKGTAEVPQGLKIDNLGGLPTNGLVKVGSYGILDISMTELPPIHGSGVSAGTTEIVVEENGLLRIAQARSLTISRNIIRLLGGNMQTIHEDAKGDHADYHMYANDLTFSDGARLYGRVPVRVGYGTKYPCWRVLGTKPSVCDSGLIALSHGGVNTSFRLYVEDVTGDESPDFFINGRMNLYAGNDDFNDINIMKLGEGTFVQNGASEIVQPNLLYRGSWIFGNSGVSEGSQEFHLAGDTTLGLANGVSNGLAKVVVKASANLQFGEGSLLTLNEIELDGNSMLELKGDFTKKSLYVSSIVPAGVLARIRCPEGRVMQDKDGYVRPRVKTFSVIIR
ncbi:MAG: hypothetical protein J6R18_06210 [Kiritimatiellae bacterium]|nr:hypothetical protein [Kiritimatiellia bacterium]